MCTSSFSVMHTPYVGAWLSDARTKMCWAFAEIRYESPNTTSMMDESEGVRRTSEGSMPDGKQKFSTYCTFRESAGYR